MLLIFLSLYSIILTAFLYLISNILINIRKELQRLNQHADHVKALVEIIEHFTNKSPS